MHAVAVAVSGGRDSMALLHATAHEARHLGLQVHALHVHHGLVAEADEWLGFLTSTCRRWALRGLPLTLHVRRLTARPAPGDSIEAWARQQRYRALAEMADAAGCALVLLAHHRRDQAETLLLQALRGGGPAGLAAMPQSALRAGITWARPWLLQPREAIEHYVQRHRLRFVDDASNADPRFARNRLRHEVWPALQAAFPDAESQLHAAARRAAEAAACLAEQVDADRAQVLVDDVLVQRQWLALSAPRRSQLLRAWLGGPESLVRRLAEELPAARIATWPLADGELRLYDGRLQRMPREVRERGDGHNEQGHGAPCALLDLGAAGRHAATGWGGDFIVEPVQAGGIEPARLQHLSLRARGGGEQFQFGARGQPRSLKKQYQLRRVPAWQRDGPLLFERDTLLFVPGLGIDARCVAAPGATQFSIVWQAAGER